MSAAPTPALCPLCKALGAVGPGPDGALVCARCGWSEHGVAGQQQEPIPTWKLLAPLVVPIALLYGSVALSHDKKGTDTPGSLLCFGLAFLLVGVWSGVNVAVWERTSERYKSAWRPNSIGTPALLAVVFSIAGLVMTAQALLTLLGGG